MMEDRGHRTLVPDRRRVEGAGNDRTFHYRRAEMSKAGDNVEVVFHLVGLAVNARHLQARDVRPETL